MDILITICARGGSKSVPGKNIRLINGNPLISYSIKTANTFQQYQISLGNSVTLALSTDSDKIREAAKAHGLASTYNRPASLSGDTVGKIDAIADILNHQEATDKKRYDFVIDLDVTSPLRTVKDLNEALHKLVQTKQALNIFSVNEASRNPYFNMVEAKADGFVQVVKKPSSSLLTRQSAPPVYDMNASFYVYRREFFTEGLRSSITDRSLAFVMDHICFDIDEPLDFDLMELLLINNKLDHIL